MSTTNFKQSPVKLSGKFIEKGEIAPDFTLVKNDLSELSLHDLKGKQVVLNIFPSLDTDVCATTVRKFNQLTANIANTVVLAISKDLPFAQSRFCTTEGIKNVLPLSCFRDTHFEQTYGLLIEEGALKGLLARAIVVIDPQGNITYTELVPEITQEPDYAAALQALKLLVSGKR